MKRQLLHNLAHAVVSDGLDYAILMEFKKVTPGFGGYHIVGPLTKAHEHPLPGTVDRDKLDRGLKVTPYQHTQRLSEGWTLVANPGGVEEIAVVTNTAPYAAYVEFGWVSTRGVYHPGHRMVDAAVQVGNVRNLYLEAANKALVVSLATARWAMPAAKASKERTQLKYGGLRIQGGKMKFIKTGVYASKGAMVARGVTTDMLKRIANNLGDQIVAAWNKAVAT